MRTSGEEHTIHLEGKPVRFLLKRGNGRRINIKVSAEGTVRVSAPSTVPVGRIKEALSNKEQWILRHVEKGEANRLPDPLEQTLFFGRFYRIEMIADKLPGKMAVDRDDGIIRLTAPSGNQVDALKVLEMGLRKKAKNHLSGRLEQLSLQTGVSYQRLSIRNQRTRWGSSSSLGNININWRIIMAPEEVIDYLLIHELIHQVHHNHSSQFYESVGRFLPSYRECNGWLKANANILGLFR